jgi:hypothetical protein
MKALKTLLIGLLLFPGLINASGNLPPVSFTETAGAVMMVGSTGESAARAGHAISGETSVRTGADGRAELHFGGGRVLRLGARTEVQLDLSGDSVTLLSGSVLLAGFDSKHGVVVKQGGKTVTITGDLTFLELAEQTDSPAKVLVVGAMSGRATVRGLGRTATLKPGDLYALDQNGVATFGQFNLTKQVATSSLVNDFQFPLPGMEHVRQAVKNFASLQARGFVRSPDASGTMVASRKLNRTGTELATLAIPQSTQGTQLSQTGVGTAGTLSLGGLSVMNSMSGRTLTGTLTTGGLTLVNNAALNFELDSAGVTSSFGASDLIISTGNLTLNGVVIVDGLANFNGGTYRLINYTGSLSANTLNISTLTGSSIGSTPNDFSIAVGTGTINLIVVPPPLPPTPLTPGQ